ncbi:MAG TPA: MBG domain-containing protein [Puia sp.]
MKHFFRFFIPVIFCLVSLGSKAATITAQQSGSWWSASTWAGGIVPGTSDVIVIPAGITVSVYGPTYDTQWNLDRWDNPAAIQVYGTLNVIDNPADGGTDYYGIYFLNPLALTVYSGGDVADNTSGGLWFLTENSALAIQTGGNFTENPNAVYTIRTEFVNGTYFPPGASTGRPQYEYDFTAVAGNQYSGPLTVAMAGGNFTATSTFTAPSGPSAPSVTTGSASSITPNTATIGGTVNDDGASTTVSFIYGTDATLTSGTSTATGAPSPIGTGSGSTAVSANLTGLSPSTKYYYEVKATNSAGNATGTILNFTTAAPLCSIVATVTSQTNVSCNGGTNGSATVSASGGTGPYTYSWSPSGGTGATASGLSANMYTVTITDANGCTKTTTATITQPTVITASVSSQTNVSCNGGSNGSATVSASGGTGPYTYSWSPSGGTGATASGLSANMYTVTITDANGCTKTTTATITQPTVITTTGAQTNVSSYGGSDGSATVSASGGTGPYTYSWSPSGGTGVTATGLAEGTYTVTITDANGCTATSSFTITQPTGTTVTSINRVSSTPANSSTVSYEVTFAANVTGISASNFSLTTSGLSGTSIDPTLTGSGNIYTVTVHTGSGNGTLALNLLNSSGILPAVSNAPFTAGDVYTIDKIAPSVSIGAPSASITKAGPVSYTITYADDNFNTSTLSSSDITVNSSGTAAAGSVSVSGSGLTRTVQLSGITGNGTLGISLAAATATDNAGNVALAAGPSATFVADNTAPITTIGNPSAASVNTGSGPISYTVAYADDNFDNSTLTTGNITLNSTGTAMGTVGITGSGTSYTVTISNISGIGTLGISVAAGTATDNAGNIASAAGPSATFAVTPIDQHITFNALSSKTYGDADFSPSATSDDNTIPVTYTSDNPAVATIIGSNIHIVSQGTVNIKASQAADANHNAATDVQQSLTVNPKSLTVTLNSTPAITKIYDGTASATLGSGNYTLNGVVGSDAVTVSGTASYDDANAGSGKTVTANAFIMDGAQKDNYTLSTTSAATTGSISAGPITVTANAKTKVYGTPDPVLDYAVTGLVNGDDASIFSGSLTRDPGENTGTYPITQGTLSAGGNYTLNFTGSLLAITSAPQQITWTQQLSVGCDGTTQLQLTGISTSGLPLTYTSSDATVATVTGDVLTLVRPGSVTITAAQPGDGNHLAATPVNNTVIYQSSSLLRQHWDDAIFFDNTGGNYVQWQWYKNGNAVSGATSPYYSETPVLSGQYYVIATDKDGRQIQTCPLNAAGNGTVTGGIKVFPNPASSGVSVTVTCNYSTSALQGAQLQVLNISGVIMQTLTSVQPTMQVTMPAARGIYIINLVLSNGQKASVNVLVK